VERFGLLAEDGCGIEEGQEDGEEETASGVAAASEIRGSFASTPAALRMTAKNKGTAKGERMTAMDKVMVTQNAVQRCCKRHGFPLGILGSS
jgi:hypothetical protein